MVFSWERRSDKTTSEEIQKLYEKKNVKRLIQLLKIDDEELKKEIILSLAFLADKKAIKPLFTIFENENGSIRTSAAVALAKLKAVSILFESYKNGDDALRFDAVYGLSKSTSFNAIEPLIEASKDVNEEIRKSAVKGLGNIGALELVKKGFEMYGNVEAMVEYARKRKKEFRDTNAVYSLIQSLRDASVSVRNAAVESLGIIGDPRSIEPLIVFLKDETMIISVIHALGQIGGNRAGEVLLPLLKENEYQVFAVYAFGHMGDARAVDPLIDILRDESSQARLAAIRILGAIGDSRAISPLSLLLFDSDVEIREAVEEALQRIS